MPEDPVITDWRSDSLVHVAGGTAALVLAAYYLLARPENVFYQPTSFTGYALGLAALMVPFLMGRPAWRRSFASMVAGAFAVTTVFVFSVGPGNLWPLAIALGTGAAAVPILVGTVVGGALSGIVRGRVGGRAAG